MVQRASGSETIPAHNIIWAAGVQAVPLSRKLAQDTDGQTDRSGRISTQPNLTLPNHPDVFVDWRHGIGAVDPSGASADNAARLAPVAIQQGRYVADVIRRRLRSQTVNPFHYHDKGSMATIGRNAAVADLNWTWCSGYLAWLIWLFVHILYLIRFENRAGPFPVGVELCDAQSNRAVDHGR